jgi:hypothetical protein
MGALLRGMMVASLQQGYDEDVEIENVQTSGGG